MSTPNLQTVRRLFSEALDLPAAERGAFVDERAGGDAELRRRVLELLGSLGRAGGYLDAPTGVGVAGVGAPAVGEAEREGHSVDPAGAVGTTIGPYLLMELIGEGGFGVVYLAEQARPIRRRVALKIIKAGMDSREVLARFDGERQALALMDHPNIARVLDAGATEGGRPFFVMELVRGVPITRFCDEAKLTPRARLELMLPVCLAVQHAHQKGVIHRDLKPGNVLVTLQDGAPVPKVIDFGIAKAVSGRLGDASVHTGFMHIVGTPAYMSPEQAEPGGVDIDTRSDVYALGVLLYELLTGTTPLAGARERGTSARGLHELITGEPAPRPSSRVSGSADRVRIAAARGMEPARLGRLVKGELDWIVLRAVEHDRARRYPTAEALAADLRRYLTGEPVLARPPGRVYLMSKFARRHRAMLVGVLAVLLVLLGGIGASTTGFLAARREGRLKDAALESESRQRTEAQQLAYSASLTAAVLAIESHDSATAARALGDAPVALRGWEWSHLASRADRSMFRTTLPERRGTQAPGFLDGHRIVTGGEGVPVRIYDCQRGVAIGELPGGPMRSFAISNSGRMVAAVTMGGELVCAEEPCTGALWRLPGYRGVSPLAFSPDDRTIVAGVEGEPTIALLDARSGAVVARAEVPGGLGSAPWFVAGVGQIWVLSHEPAIWRAYTSGLMRSNDPIAAPTWFPSGRGRWICSRYLDRISVSAPEHEGMVRWSTQAVNRRPYLAPAVDPTGELVVSCDEAGSIALWEVSTGEQIGSYMGAQGAARVSLSDDGLWVGASDSSGGVRVFPTDERAWPFEVPYEGEDRRAACAFSSDGRLGVACGWGFVEAWDPMTGRRLWQRGLSRSVMLAIGVSRDARTVICSAAGGPAGPGDSARGETWVLEAETGQVRHHRRDDGLVVLDLDAGLTAGEWIAACGDGRIRVLDAGTGRPLRELGPGDLGARVVRSADLAPRALVLCRSGSGAGPVAVSADEDVVRVIDTASLSSVRTIRCPGESILGVAISPDGAMGAAITGEGVLRAWSLETGELLWEIRDHPVEDASVEFSPDATRIAAMTSDGVVRLVDTAGGRVAASLRGARPLGRWRFVDSGKSLVGATLGTLSRVLETGERDPNDQQIVGTRRERALQWRAARALDGVWEANAPQLAEDRARAIERDARLPDAVRREASARARLQGDCFNYLNSGASGIVAQPGRDSALYRGCVQVMEATCRAWPDEPSFRNTLASAYYRAGRIEDAERAYREAVELRRAAGRAGHPIDLMMLGAILIRKGDRDAGSAMLRQGIESLSAGGAADDSESRAWRREAEGLALEGPQR